MKKTIYSLIFFTLFLVLPVSPDLLASQTVNQTPKKDTGSQVVSEEIFQKIFRNYLCKSLEKNESDIIITKFKVTGNTTVPVGKIKIQLYQKDQGVPTGLVRLVGVIRINGVAQRKVTLSGWVDVFDNVVCARRNLTKGQVIQEEDICLARKNITRLSNDGVLTDAQKVLGFTLKNSVRENTCLKEWMLSKTPIVEKGDVVMIVAQNRELRVTVLGKVLEKGYEGNLVKVENSMSKKTVYARVINNSTVMVSF